MSKNFENFIQPTFTDELRDRVAGELNQLAAVRNMEIGYFNGRSYIDGLGALTQNALSAGHTMAVAANETESVSHGLGASVMKASSKGSVLRK